MVWLALSVARNTLRYHAHSTVVWLLEHRTYRCTAIYWRGHKRAPAVRACAHHVDDLEQRETRDPSCGVGVYCVHQLDDRPRSVLACFLHGGQTGASAGCSTAVSCTRESERLSATCQCPVAWVVTVQLKVARARELFRLTWHSTTEPTEPQLSDLQMYSTTGTCYSCSTAENRCTVNA